MRYKIDEIVQLIMDYRGKTPKKLGMNWTENQKDIIALSAKNIKDNKIVNTDKSHYGSELLYKHWMKDGDIKPGDILMTSEAPLGEVYLVSKPIKAILSQRLFLLRFNKKIVNPWYMYAFMNSQSFKNQLLLRATGTTVVGIKQKDLRKIEVELPSRELQNKIGSIFQFLYKKIHINGRINDNLLELLDTEFHHQFSHQTHFRREKIRDYVKITRGSSPRPIKNFLTTFGRPWIKISDISNLSSPYLYKTKQYISKLGISKSKTVIPGTLILSNSATPGIPVISKIVASVHDGWLIISDYKLMNRNWFYLFFRQIRQELLKRANGSVFDNLKISIVENFPINVPNKDLLKRFEKISDPIFSEMEKLQLENIRLTKIKEALLNLYF